MPDEARIIYLLLVLVLLAPAGLAAFKKLRDRRRK